MRELAHLSGCLLNSFDEECFRSLRPHHFSLCQLKIKRLMFEKGQKYAPGASLHLVLIVLMREKAFGRS
ncbi:unnamed protein product [Meloidogyne enterolobii]|uniref:Uncharacterized protein n=1 Tax=Meloidogyne enterolobii TaxID=390850 RepID=A0ACB0ZEP0_MELEN